MTCSSKLFSLSLIIGLLSTNINSINAINKLSNGCNNKADGEYWFLLSDQNDDEYMPVKLQCSNEHVILDISKDSNLESYFSSYQLWHTHLAGPANHDPCTWYEWFLPETSKDNALGSYYISPDCEHCDLTNDYQVHGSKSSYWMTGNLAKLRWNVIAFAECDMDWDTYTCYNCETCFSVSDGCEPTAYDITTTTNYVNSGLCGVTIEAADQDVYYSRVSAQSADDAFNYKPSLGTEGEFCMCYQPAELKHYQLTETQQAVIVEAETSAKNNKNNKNSKNIDKKDSDNDNEEEESEDLRDSNVVYLTQEDFNYGTYRIKKSGTYIISEDIVFDFNNNDDYWPRSDQSDEYFGALSYRDPYHLGFFAGITVESDYVTIDLNGKELKQSVKFYYQQRWFAIIELSNQPFLPGQGPAFFGSNPVIVSNTVIKNGVLGLTSHFGIHANFPTNLVIENVHIKDFVTHGLQLNGWTGLEMNNIEVGPSSTIEYLRGDYGHARIILQRLGWIEDDMREEGTLGNKVEFNNHENPSSIMDLEDNLQEWMEIALDYAMNRATDGKYSENNYVNPNLLDMSDKDDLDKWEQIKAQFVQESGLPSASSVTGLFLNFYGASVFSYTKYTTRQSSDGVLNNIYIHDISHEMKESMRFTWKGAMVQVYPTPWASDIPAERAFGSYDTVEEFYELISQYNDGLITSREVSFLLDTKFQYKGSALTDAYFAMSQFSDSWDYLGFLLTDNRDEEDYSLSDWVKGKTYSDDPSYVTKSSVTGELEYTHPMTDWRVGCNQDIMAHSGKGLLGLRVDGVNNLILNDIKVDNLNEYTALGSNACGEYLGYSFATGGGHFHQTTPMQVGFSGNMLQGISIISTVATLSGNIEVSNLNNDYGAGFGMSFWTANDVTFEDDLLINVNNIHAGIKISNDDEQYSDLTTRSLPNQIPEACSVRLQYDTSQDYYESVLTMSNEGNDNIVSCNVNGNVGCTGEDYYHMYGNYFDGTTEANVCQNVKSFDDLQVVIKNSEHVSDENASELDDNNNIIYIMSSIFNHKFDALTITFIGVVGALFLMAIYCKCSNNGGLYDKIDNFDDVDGPYRRQYGSVV